LSYQTPAAFAAKLTATGHHAAIPKGSACRPVAQPAQRGISKAEILIAAGDDLCLEIGLCLSLTICLSLRRCAGLR
jgi:hypothetical protein